MTKAEKKYGIWLTDIAFEGLSIHIALSIKRYQSHHISESHEASHYTDIDPLPYQMADVKSSMKSIDSLIKTQNEFFCFFIKISKKRHFFCLHFWREIKLFK